ncbi:2-oxo-4-hydroxy-4-carboxy-5-ureidoimidazoline decarboxylase [Streptomyces sp. NPDC060194]|uniref:2-oxo-4-hydroxy-4-carboxy-5-ureidoimidazoline decarboxylase n=1 Tax=Streptomyces sp. NPDC060194 TaxID=3347069 RepID=UPI00365134AB
MTHSGSTSRTLPATRGRTAATLPAAARPFHRRHAVLRSPLTASQEPPLSSRPDRRPPGLDRLNAAPLSDALDQLLACCACPEWAARIAAHRPYPDLGSLLAAADEAAYDLSPAALTAALAAESAPRLPPGSPGPPAAAHTALSAAYSAYESRFGHAFVICLDAFDPSRRLDQLLAAVRTRLALAPEDERALAADELRALVRGRLARALARPGTRSDSPYVPV